MRMPQAAITPGQKPCHCMTIRVCQGKPPSFFWLSRIYRRKFVSQSVRKAANQPNAIFQLRIAVVKFIRRNGSVRLSKIKSHPTDIRKRLPNSARNAACQPAVSESTMSAACFRRSEGRCSGWQDFTESGQDRPAQSATDKISGCKQSQVLHRTAQQPLRHSSPDTSTIWVCNSMPDSVSLRSCDISSAARGVRQHLCAQRSIRRVHRHIERRKVKTTNPVKIGFGQSSSSVTKFPYRKRQPVIVILHIQSIAQTFRHLVHKTKKALVRTGSNPVKHGAFQFQPKIFIDCFVDVKLDRPPETLATSSVTFFLTGQN